MRFSPRNTLTTKLVIMTGILTTIIVVTTGLIFSVSYKIVLDRENRNLLVKEGEEVISEQIVYDAGQIKYRLSASGESLANRLRGYNISAIIYDAKLNRLGSYGIYKNLTESSQLTKFVPKTQIQEILSQKQPKFGYFILDSGLRYDTYTTFILTENREVGVVQFAKESEFNNRIINLNMTTLAFLVPLVILISWWVYRYIIRRSLTPLNELIGYLQKFQPHQTLQKIKLSSHPTDEITELVDTFNDLLERIGESLTKQKDFISHASHELRTPLTQAISSLDLALHYKDETRRDKYVTGVKQELLELNHILDSLLGLSKLENPSSSQPNLQSLNLAKSIAGELDNFSSQIEEKNLEVSVECPINIQIRFSKEHLHILLTNLISNAIKYNIPQGKLQILVKNEQSKITCGITNSGSEITPEEQKQIFDKFFRGKTANSISGSGLGLALVKRICDLDGVKVWLESTSSQTTFWLTFPIFNN